MADQSLPESPYVPWLDDDPSYQRWREETKRQLGIKSDDAHEAPPAGLPVEAWAELLPPAQAQAVREAEDRRRGIVLGEVSYRANPVDSVYDADRVIHFDRMQAAEEELRMRRAKPARVVIERSA